MFFSPVPSYNWTRRGAPLPKNSYLTSFNRVLIIPHVEVDDQGEYICRAYNDRASIANSVILDIQGNFVVKSEYFQDSILSICQCIN